MPTVAQLLKDGLVTSKNPIPSGAANNVLQTDGASPPALSYAAAAGSSTPPFAKNMLINGEMIVSQRGSSFGSGTVPATSNATYLVDRWCFLAQIDNAAQVAQQTGEVYATADTRAIMFGITSGAANKRYGFCQIIESRNMFPFIDGFVSLSFKVGTQSGHVINNVGAVVLGSSADSSLVPRDVVSDWTTTPPTFTGGASGWAELAAPTIIPVPVDTLNTVKVENIPIIGGRLTLAVLIYVNDTDAAIDDVLMITDVQLEQGAVATPIERRPFPMELAMCQRYYESSIRYGIEAIPANIIGVDEVSFALVPNGGSAWGNFLPFKTSKRTDKYLLTYCNSAASGELYVYTAAGAGLSVVPSNGKKTQCGFAPMLAADNTRVLAIGAFLADDEI
jgi:hypothetical protein